MHTHGRRERNDLRAPAVADEPLRTAGPGIASKRRADERRFLAQAQLSYFDTSRRAFLQLSGLALTRLFLRGQLFADTAQAGGSTPARIDEAVAWALHDAGVKIVTHVPATGATTLFDAQGRLSGVAPSYAFSEEVAYTPAHGAALAGVRSAAVMKSYGLPMT